MKKIQLILLAFLGVATAFKAVANLFANGDLENRRVVSYSIEEARTYGILSTELDVTVIKSDFTTDYTQIIEEAWIEEYSIHDYSYVWFHKRAPQGGFMVIMKPKEGTDSRTNLWPLASGSSFAHRVGSVFIKYYEEEPSFPIVIEAMEGREKTPVLKLTKPNKAVDTTAANARLFHSENSKSTISGMVAMTEAAVVSP